MNKQLDALERNALSSELRERLKQQIGEPNWFDDLEKELIDALQKSSIKCFGIKNNIGSMQEIPNTEWIDMKFYYGIPTIEAGPEYLFTRGASKWTKLKFSVSDILNKTEKQNETYWDLIHTLAWIYARDNEPITQEDAYEIVLTEAQRRFVSGNLAAAITLHDKDDHDEGTKTPTKRKNRYTPRGALGQIMLSNAELFANIRNGALMNNDQMLAALKKQNATVKKSDDEYVIYTDIITGKQITLKKKSFVNRMTSIRNHLKENTPRNST